MSRTIASLHERRCRRGSDCVVSVREEEANEPRGPVRVGATKGGQFTVSKRIIDRLILASVRCQKLLYLGTFYIAYSPCDGGAAPTELESIGH